MLQHRMLITSTASPRQTSGAFTTQPSQHTMRTRAPVPSHPPLLHISRARPCCLAHASLFSSLPCVFAAAATHTLRMTSDIRRQTSDIRRQTSDIRHQTSKSRERRAESGEQSREGRERRAERGEQRAGWIQDVATASVTTLALSLRSFSVVSSAPASASGSPQINSSGAAPAGRVPRFYGTRLVAKCEVGASVPKNLKCNAGTVFAAAAVDTGVKPYTLPTWADFGMGNCSVCWETATGRPPTSRLGKELARDGACENAIYPEAVFVEDRCAFPAGLIQEGGDRCELDIVPGCTDPESPSFDPLANVDDGSCPFDP